MPLRTAAVETSVISECAVVKFAITADLLVDPIERKLGP